MNNENNKSDMLKDTETATPKNETENGGSTDFGKTENDCCDADSKDFDNLIKGEYKDAFASKVQKIIDSRFKDYKTLEQKNKQLNDKLTELCAKTEELKSNDKIDNGAKTKPTLTDGENASETTFETGTENNRLFDYSKEMENPQFATLVNCGIDPETAYTALHIDSVMDGSMRYGAAMAAKKITENIRSRAARPTENALYGTVGTVIKKGASCLTAEKRRELARKSLMGEKIGF